MDKISIYIMTHKAFDAPEDPVYVPLHVGAALHDELPYLSDATGENISSKNLNFCELTGLYWIWKNDRDSDIVGLCHYRRYFVDETGDKLGREQIESALSEVELIVTPKYVLNGSTIKEHYISEHHAEDVEAVRNAIEKLYPDYLKTFDEVMDGDRSYFANMFITRKELADRYCEWLFDVLFETEKNLDISDYDAYSSRVYGFLSERLFTVWLFHNNIKVREQDIEEMTPRWELYDGLEDVIKSGDTARIYEHLKEKREQAVRIINEGHDFGGRIRGLYMIVETAHNGGDIPLSYELLKRYL